MFKIISETKKPNSLKTVTKSKEITTSTLYKFNKNVINSTTGFIGTKNGISVFCSKICPFTTQSSMPDTF
jgi:hypothetical protein